MTTEKRVNQLADLRAKSEGDKRSIAGYAATFETLSLPLGRFVEKIARGAFSKSLGEDDVRALWSHNPDMPLGRTGNSTLRLWEDHRGLAFELELPDTQWGRDAFTSIQRGDVSGMSFGFDVREDAFQRGSEGQPHIRTLLDVRLHEISPVAFPAYTQTNVQVRDLSEQLRKLDLEVEEEEGMSISLARKKLDLVTL